MRVEPLSEDVLVDRVVERVLAVGREQPRAVRLLVDGHPSTRPEDLADRLVAPLRAAGRPVARVRVQDFWRPASLRLERGREDPDALLDEWVDVAGLRREVLDAVGPGGTGRYLPSLRDPATSRSTRAAYVEAEPGLVVVLDGALCLGLGLALDLTVHLALRPATLARRTAPGAAWTLAAYGRYAQEVRPEDVADVVVRVDDPRHPALVVR
ncbi:uridine kinase [Cellulosimicrobium sp. XJ-DQ-B-000]|uniref:uridine kinase n=1 Tax=Cellulosimicrobium sp. XJ-DQ-B-000 TaxID=3072182 RepID=UPI00280874FA|nr:uridine kinase [Cellulosimicrobium sp. XJ-DQ-B-000]MDQ8041856.1 uridine kinase [Cellulosimicrobium sp. XJ-DQ-B-000]